MCNNSQIIIFFHCPVIINCHSNRFIFRWRHGLVLGSAHRYDWHKTWPIILLGHWQWLSIMSAYESIYTLKYRCSMTFLSTTNRQHFIDTYHLNCKKYVLKVCFVSIRCCQSVALSTYQVWNIASWLFTCICIIPVFDTSSDERNLFPHCLLRFRQACSHKTLKTCLST